MIRDYFNIVFSVYRETEISGSYGQPITTGSLYMTGSGYFESLTGDERFINDKNEVYAQYLLITDVNDIKEADTIIIGSITYNVKFSDNVKNHHMEITLSKRI